jgi:hypothetical protein
MQLSARNHHFIVEGKCDDTKDKPLLGNLFVTSSLSRRTIAYKFYFTSYEQEMNKKRKYVVLILPELRHSSK